jgi:signal transduction histidine kinase
MRLVQAGDLTARAPEDAADELGRVGRGLNAMVARLAEEQRSREERHAEEIRQAEHVASLGRRATVGTITSGIAHELNNPLNNISLTVETLMEDYQSLDDKAKWQLLQDTYFQVERASEIVRSLLDFTREEKPSLEPLDLGELVQSSVRLVQNEMNIHGATLSLKLPASTPQVQGAANQLRQVFLNLFLNAIQAMPDGGAVTVTLAQPHPGRVCVLVSDEGVGIPEEAQSHVFDPFFTTKEPGAGSGLGLWVTYGIVRKHGGDIRVESEPGRGTTFHVCLPATGPSESATDAQTTAEER